MREGLPEAWLVWTLFGLVALAVFVTYSRLPRRELYHVSGSGIAGGAGRALVFLGFPSALGAIAVLVVIADRLEGRLARALGVTALLACASVAWPGVFDERDLDASWAKVPAAEGTLLVFMLTFTAARVRRERDPPPSRRGDLARAAVVAVVLLVGLPYMASDLGFFLDGVPVLGSIFITGTHPHHSVLPAVHHGHHHGMDGMLLATTALLLGRTLGAVRRRLRPVVAAYLSLLFVYGATNLANDLWDEQIFKRGWTDWLIPNVIRPSVSAAWGAMLLAAALLYALALGPRPLLARR